MKPANASVRLMLCLGAALLWGNGWVGSAFAVGLQIATFQVDVTPPIGSPLCDAAVPPAKGVNDPLSARGIMLKADDQVPVVLVAVDWVGIGNEGHDAWREAIADACNTPKDRVSVHTLHQHDAPGCDFLAESIAAEAGLPNRIFPVEFSREAISRVAAAAQKAGANLQEVSAVGVGAGRVEGVASNRRILGPDGKVEFVRFTSCPDPKVRAFPEGIIDPFVRLLSFWSGDEPIAVLSYYATHPQSYYQTGMVSADFVGMARDAAQQHEGTPLHIHFNGAGGNIGAGKFNDGSPENRPVLADRLAKGMAEAWKNTKKFDVSSLDFDWSTRGVRLPITRWYDDDAVKATLNDASADVLARLRAAREIAWASRCHDGHEICVGRLRLGPIDVIHLPGELFVEYQLAAQSLRPQSFVCTAAYGDYGPGYIGTAEAYYQGGYETGQGSRASRVSPRAELALLTAIQELLE